MDFLEDLENYEEAMNNAYLIITKKKTVEDIYKLMDTEDEYGEYDEFYLPFNPLDSDGRDHATLSLLIDFFEEREDYEKCSKLVKIKKCLKEQIG